jgi:deazaflavin-dependent oxidoreductase (nitroreductase family)
MDKRVTHVPAHDRTIDITARGRKTRQLRRTEIWFHHIDGQVYITGTPGRRDWYANLSAHPEFTFHLKQSTKADLSARATPILETATRYPSTPPDSRATDQAQDRSCKLNPRAVAGMTAFVPRHALRAQPKEPGRA